jgi:diguanylate cyclase (GGDEF)-like protein
MANLWLSMFGAIGLCSLAFVPGVIRADRQWFIVAVALGLIPFAGLAGFTRRVHATEGLIQSTYGLAVLLAVGYSTGSTPIDLLAGFSVGLVAMTAAMVQQRRQAIGVLISCEAVAMAILTQTPGLGPAAPLVYATMIALTISPTLTVMRYRRDLEQALAAASFNARTDDLTGLLNRRGMAELAAVLVAGARRREEWVGVLVVDVDHFKRINDSFGHGTGDEVLRTLAEVLAQPLRESDLLVRLGGEEICVIVTLSGPRELALLAERLRATVERAEPVFGRPVTISVGAVCRKPGRGDARSMLMSMIDAADLLMYQAKQAGRNTVRTAA